LFHLIGCSPQELATHIEKLWQPGMTWANRGKNSGWEIDHVFPVSFFDMRDKAEAIAAFNFSNLAPRWRRDNRAKWDFVLTPEGPMRAKDARNYLIECGYDIKAIIRDLPGPITDWAKYISPAIKRIGVVS
jgi:hypothetical protein